MVQSQQQDARFRLLVILAALSLLLGGCMPGQESAADDHGQDQALHQHDAAPASSDPDQVHPHAGSDPGPAPAHAHDATSPDSAQPNADPSATNAPMAAHNMRNMFPEVDEIYDRIEAEGVAVEFTVTSADSFYGPKNVEEGGLATVKFRLTDAKSGEPLADHFPKAWIDRRPASAAAGGAEQQTCQQQVASYLRGVLTDRAQIDLNSFFVLSLNSEASISVIDPLVNLGGITQLYAMLALPKPGEDWAITQDQMQMFVTMPAAGQVAVADLDSFQTVKNIDTGGVPVRAAFQPDEKYLWVGDDSSADGAGGVVVIDPAAQALIARIPTGAGHHALAFSPDSRHVFVTNEQSGTLTVIDTQSLQKVQEVATGSLPVAVGVSAPNASVYVANGGDGTLTVLDSGTFAPRAILQFAPGLYALRISPDGRWVFVTNPTRNEVYIVDASNNQHMHTLSIDGAPDQVIFSATAAYLRALNKPNVSTIQLRDLGLSDPPPVKTVIYGQKAPSASPFQAVADALVPSAREQAVLITSPGDAQIYFQSEGTASPSGSFQGYGRIPRAVRIVERGFRQEAPGIYSARFRVPESGDFDVALFLEDPQIVHCFRFTARHDSTVAVAKPVAPPKIEFLTEERQFKVGEEIRLRFALADSVTGRRMNDRAGVIVQLGQIGGNWSRRVLANQLEDGIYEIRITVPQPGRFTAYFTIPSAKVGLDQLPPLTVEVDG